jgi:predicted RNA-binding Zn ribbon-like protein
VDLTVVERFLNTLDARTFSRHGSNHVAQDELTSLEALTGWLQEQDLLAPDEELRPGDLEVALSLRSALRASLLGETSDSQLLDGFPLRLVPDERGDGLRLAAASGVPSLDSIVETVAVAAADGRWKRLKLCASEDCRWAFYDTSRSGGGRWCSMEICGNRHKTRTYRRRQAPDAGR